ncbi:Rpn family recombination-promoting nuclease/putative transposase [Desulfonema magnum]|uniref:Transposase, RpnA-like n=1 Tax=Desulfonema magnum TaxID=45655 RepID=A0A975BHV3_9BACT|nr:Rpn family recombination-promoting nuclease/putative transposase [Desulfonema magnum]QTA85792.1 Putative transposase, RpnA-like [Desulfonema magnum]
MRHRIDPTVDCVFKAVLGSEKHKNLLIHFLNAVLEKENDSRITEVVIMNPYNEREFETDKLSIVDIRAKDETDSTYQIEVQISVHTNLPSRMLYTWSTVYHSLIGKGDSFSLLTPVISIWILTGNLFPEIDDCHIPFLAWNSEHEIMLSDHFGIHVLQLPKWQESLAGHTEKDRWLYFFKEGKNTDPGVLPDILDTEEMREAMSVIKDFSENQKNYHLYQSRLAALSEIATWKEEVEKAVQAMNEARREKENAIKNALKEKEKAQKAIAKVQKEKEKAIKEAQKEKEKAIKEVQKEKEKAQKEKEKAQKEKEKARKEKEKIQQMRLLLEKAGIDPDQTEV